jgi:hypothetical protein
MMITCLCKLVGASLDTFIVVVAAYGIRRGCSNFLLESQPVHAREYVRASLPYVHVGCTFTLYPLACFLLSMECTLASFRSTYTTVCVMCDP